MSDDILNFDMFINGTWQPASDGETIEVFNPATGEIAVTVPRGRRTDLDTVVSAARCGLAVWRDTHPAARMRIMMRIADALRSRAQEFAEIESLDTGESIISTLWTVKDVCARRFEYYAGCADKILGDTFMAPGTNFSYTLREPVGVTAHIVPWNGPLWTGSRSIAPALAGATR
jgi:acyl-CoA reductase-like NAD-dependent aldehyde dehydrogenase